AAGDGDGWADQDQGNGGSRGGGEAKRSEIYTYEAGWHIYGMNWSVRRDKKYRLAIASLLEQLVNRVEVVQLDESTGDIAPVLSFDHPFPPTKSMFVPDPQGLRPDLLATSADLLRIWRITDDDAAAPGAADSNNGSVRCNGVGGPAGQQPGVKLCCELNGNRNSDFCGPLTSFDWNDQDPRYMATIIMDSPKVVVLDIRYPTLPVVELHRHHAPVNAIAWAPHSSCHICTAGDDSQALIWDLSSMGTGNNSGGNGNGNGNAAAAAAAEGGLDPILAYTAGAEVEQLQWSATQPDWVAIVFANKLQILRV
uniref:Uncharacterized protein n=1 Tax=Aegilops tauschii subsp. strangulata TaxID=200361 RepID=A0A453NYQ6_AEGTS